MRVPKAGRLVLIMAGVAVAAAVAGGIRPASAAGPLSVDTLVRYFDTIVFGSELDPKYADTVIAKWPQKVITLSLEPWGQVDPALTKQFLVMVKTHVAALSQLTGRRFGGARDPAKADIRMFFVHRQDMGKITGPNVDAEAVRKGAAAGGCYFLDWKKTREGHRQGHHRGERRS